MSDIDFSYLFTNIVPIITKQDTRLRKVISAKERFVVTVRFLASGKSYEDLSYISKISPHLISNIVMEFCATLITIFADQIKVGKMKEINIIVDVILFYLL